jgi:hypothetical protein
VKYAKSSYNGSAKELNVVLLNDLHFGSHCVDYDLFEKRILPFIEKNKKNTRILINGDLIEGITKQSKGDIYNQKLSPKEQIDKAVEYLMPYSKLIDGVTIGNHDWRVMNETSLDPIEIFCKYLGIKEKYLGSHGVVNFNCNGINYSFELHHGTGGGSTVASVESSMKRLWKSDSHIMYCGHWHKEYAKPIKRFRINNETGEVCQEKRWMICGNTILNTEEYARRGGFEESFPSQAVVKLSGEQRNIDVFWIR